MIAGRFFLGRAPLLFLLGVQVLGSPQPAIGTALDDYVAAPDQNYSYNQVGTFTGSVPDLGSYTAYVLELTSQAWRTPAEVDRTIWKHWLTIVVPDVLTITDKGLLRISHGSNDDPAPSSVDDEVATAAVGSGSIASVIGMVPNQPLRFAGETFDRWEDQIISYTFRKYLDTGDGTWPALLPMVKSAVRAMDAIQDFVSSQSGGSVNINAFVVTGESKRGWTTWLTAAVDPRVIGIAPRVIDVLNIDEQMDHHYAAYGFYAEAVGDYVDAGVMEDLHTPEGQTLLRIVDPYEYRARYASIPKLMLNSTGDEFFVPDSAQFYFAGMPGEKLLQYLPNTSHGLNWEAIESMWALYYSVLYGVNRPQLSWTLEGDDSIRVQTTTVPDLTLTSVQLWQGSVQPTGATGARDFRLQTTGPIWTSSPLSDQGGGVYVGQVNVPGTGWTGFLVELTYDNPGPLPYKVTTQVRVIPEPVTTTLTLNVTNEARGSVEVDPNHARYYDPNTVVTLTAQPIEGKAFKRWKIHDPNHPDDANYVVFDANNPLTVVMDTDREITAVFKCGGGVGQPLAMMGVGVVLCGLASRRTRRWR